MLLCLFFYVYFCHNSCIHLVFISLSFHKNDFENIKTQQTDLKKKYQIKDGLLHSLQYAGLKG